MPAWVSGSPVPPEARLGKVLQNEFHILRVLGEGELGVTYEAENSRLKGKFAVLMLRRELKPTQGMMLSVQKDLRAAQPLQTAGLMPVKMIVDQFDIPGFATELLDGETLRQRLRRGPLRTDRAIAIVLYVAKALDALHKAGAVHGDLRPENIFLVRPGAKSSFAGKVVIVEHSLHHLRRRPSGLDDQLPLYKLMYRPPELLAGETGPHPGGDVFVLGAILHECLTGKPAFFDEVADFVIDNLHQPPRALTPSPQLGLLPDLCKALDELTQCACARDPKERLPDMASLVVGLEALVKAKGIKLPDVLTEAPDAATPESNQTEQRMHRLLERRSGVFPVLGPPPAEPALPTVPKPAASPAQPAAAASPTPAASPPIAASSPAPAKTVDALAPLQAITAPKKKVTQILQKLSGAFPVLTVSADGSAIEEHTVQPQAAKASAEAVTLVAQPTQPVEAKPVEAKPVEAQPVEAKPVEAKPVEAKPVEAKPVEAKPVEAKPVEAKPVEAKPVEAKPVEEPISVVSVDAATQPKAEAKPVLKANVAEALSRLRKPGLVVEPKGPPPAALPFEIPPVTPVVTAPEPPKAEPPKTTPPLAPSPPAEPKEPPKTMPPLAPAAISDEKLAAAPAKPPESKRRVSESTLQVDNVEDLLVSMPSLLAIPIEPVTPPLPPSAQSPKPPRIPEPPQTLSAVPTSAALEILRTSHDPALLSAPTQPLVPALLADLLTPPVTKPPAAPEPLLTPPVTSPPQHLGALHEAPTRTKLPIDDISMVPTQAAVEAIAGLVPNPNLAITPSVVPVIPIEAKPSGKVSQDSGESIHDKPTAAVIPSVDLMMSRHAPHTSQPPPSVPPSVPPPSVPPPSVPPPSHPHPDPQRLLESNPILRPETPKEPLAPADSPKPDPKLMLPAQVSTAHTTLAPRAIPNKPVSVPQAPEPGLRALLLRHQELVAAGIGALIVLLIGLLFSVLIR